MARGLSPTRTYSAHWIADGRFAAAIEDFLGQETEAVGEYLETLNARQPFHKE
jgi:predicted N-acyltransferase